MEEKNQLAMLIQKLKTEIDHIEKSTQRNEMDVQVRMYHHVVDT